MTKLLRWGFAVCVLLGFTLTAQAQTATVLTASRSGTYGETLSGSLKTVTGSGVPFTNVYLNTVDTNARLGVATQSLPGTVPATAVMAELGLQLGGDGIGGHPCVCNGAAGVVVGGLTYTDSGNNHGYFAKVVPTSFPYPNVAMAMETLSLQPGENTTQILTTEQQIANGTKGQQFQVTANGNFTLTAPIMATANAAQAGYVFVNFLDASGHIVPNGTFKIWFAPNQNLLQTLTTDLNGNFSYSLPPHVYLGDPQMRVDFPGNGLFGANTITLAPIGLNPANTLPALQQPITNLGSSSAPMIWLSPRADFLGGVNGNGWNWVYSQWPNAAAKTQMLRIPADSLKTFSVDNLAYLVWNMNHANPPLYLEVEIEPNDNWNSNQPANCVDQQTCCGTGESYSAPSVPNDLASLLMQAGANVAVVAMDEPFYNGKVNKWNWDANTNQYVINTQSCRYIYEQKGLTYTALDEAQNASLLLNIYKAAFPNLIYGDVEPFPIFPDNDSNWVSDYRTFVQQVHTLTGLNMVFMHMDVDWDLLLTEQKTVSSELNLVAPVVRGSPLNMKFGVFVDSKHSDKNDASQWMLDAQHNIWCIINSGTAPEQLPFATWDPQPTLTVPESNSQALSYLIDYYENRTSGTCNN